MIEESLGNNSSEIKSGNSTEGFWERKPDASVSKTRQIGDENLLGDAESHTSNGIEETSDLFIYSTIRIKIKSVGCVSTDKIGFNIGTCCKQDQRQDGKEDREREELKAAKHLQRSC